MELFIIALPVLFASAAAALYFGLNWRTNHHL